MEGKTVLLTGGNSGIGRETVVALARMGATVYFTARDRARGEAALADARSRSGGDVHLLDLDMSSLPAVRGFAKDFVDRTSRLDVLVNNAGAVQGERRLTADGLEASFAVNHLAPFVLTGLLLDALKASAPSRIVNVASHAHRGARNGLDFDDLQFERDYAGMRAYSRSKLANILFTRELARRVAGTGVTVNAVHPGAVRTGFGADGDARPLFALGIKIAGPFMLSPERGARTSVWAASAPELEGVTGGYFAKCKPARLSVAARDDDAARRLWDASERLANA